MGFHAHSFLMFISFLPSSWRSGTGGAIAVLENSGSIPAAGMECDCRLSESKLFSTLRSKTFRNARLESVLN